MTSLETKITECHRTQLFQKGTCGQFKKIIIINGKEHFTSLWPLLKSLLALMNFTATVPFVLMFWHLAT